MSATDAFYYMQHDHWSVLDKLTPNEQKDATNPFDILDVWASINPMSRTKLILMIANKYEIETSASEMDMAWIGLTELGKKTDRELSDIFDQFPMLANMKSERAGGKAGHEWNYFVHKKRNIRRRHVVNIPALFNGPYKRMIEAYLKTSAISTLANANVSSQPDPEEKGTEADTQQQA